MTRRRGGSLVEVMVFWGILGLVVGGVIWLYRQQHPTPLRTHVICKRMNTSDILFDDDVKVTSTLGLDDGIFLVGKDGVEHRYTHADCDITVWYER